LPHALQEIMFYCKRRQQRVNRYALFSIKFRKSPTLVSLVIRLFALETRYFQLSFHSLFQRSVSLILMLIIEAYRFIQDLSPQSSRSITERGREKKCLPIHLLCKRKNTATPYIFSNQIFRTGGEFFPFFYSFVVKRKGGNDITWTSFAYIIV
jgi:hypothetical protein